MRVAYIGNFVPPHSTENHVATALRNNGHRVVPFQENAPTTWARGAILKEEPDFVLWTRTWHLPQFHQAGVLRDLRRAKIPTVAYHLDRWWGLSREHQVREEPMFRCDLVVTADGGHDDDWRKAGVEHVWFPPAVLAAETVREGHVMPRRFPEPIVFVGSWQTYHAEWSYRLKLIAWLKATYGRRFGAWPKDRRAVRGQQLVDLYTTARIVIGDSCLVPNRRGPITRYWSDRIPETLGRGGLLVHPVVEGLFDHHPESGLLTYPLGDFDALREIIDHHSSPTGDATRESIRSRGRLHVQAHHTYEHRMTQLVDVLEKRGML